MAEEAKAEAAVQGERLGWDEIRRRYPDEWVVLTDTEGPHAPTISGLVHSHSPDKKTAYALSNGLRRCAIFWTGQIKNPTAWHLRHVVQHV